MPFNYEPHKDSVKYKYGSGNNSIRLRKRSDQANKS